MYIQGKSLARGPKLLSMYTIEQRGFATIYIYRVSLSLEAPNYCLCLEWNSAGFSFVNTGKQVHLKDARWHFERNLVKDVHHRSVASRNWLKSQRQGEADLTPADFFLQGLLKGKAYKNTPRTIEQLKRRYTPRDSNCQRRHFEKSVPELI